MTNENYDPSYLKYKERFLTDDALPKPKEIKPRIKDENQLTHRQQEIFDLICQRGISNKQIAKTLDITESTVKIHVSAILKKLCVRNRTQLLLSKRM